MRFLQQVLLRGRYPNGMLFWGPEGVGKRTTAIAFAKTLFCTAGTGSACGECLACRKVEHDNHPDLKFIRPAGKTRIIRVEMVEEEMIELATYRPFEGGWRVVVVEDADRMNEAAQTHFLKTLEEPPSATMFVLISEFPRRMLPAIRSRCQHVRFGALHTDTVKALLLGERHLPEGVAAAIAAISQGQMSRALDFVDTGKRDIVIDVAKRLGEGVDPLVLSQEFAAHLEARGKELKSEILAQWKEEEGEALKEMSREDREDREEEIEATVEGMLRREVMEYFYLFSVWFRDAMVLDATGDDGRVLNRDHMGDLAKSGAGDPHKRLAAIEKAWLYSERNLRRDRVIRDMFFALAPATTAAR